MPATKMHVRALLADEAGPRRFVEGGMEFALTPSSTQHVHV
jgi:hypothetical protein